METWLSRLIEERGELIKKRDKLSFFLGKCSESHPHYSLLERQLRIMNDYLDVLEERIEL